MLIIFYADFLFAKEYCQHYNNFKKYILDLESSNDRRKAEYKYFICNYSQGYLYADIIRCNSPQADCINNQYVNDVCDYFLSKHEFKLRNREIIFFKKYDEFNLFTEFNIGDKFYYTDTAKIIPLKIDAFVIRMEGENIFTFKLRFIVPDKRVFGYENIFTYSIISNNPELQVLRYKLDLDSLTIYNLISRFKDIIVFPGREPANYMGFPPYFAIFEGNYTNSDEKEYIISYHKDPIYYQNVFGICIVNQYGKIIRELKEVYYSNNENDYESHFNPDDIIFDYKNIIYVSDLDNDGIDELVMSNEFMVGACIEIWKNFNGIFKRITCGFCIGS